MRKLIKIIDSISEWTGMTVRWVCVALVLVLVYEVTMRYVFNAPTIWAYETGTMLGGTIAALGWAYTHRHHGHVRIDVFYDRLTARKKALTDVIGALIFFFPLLFALTYIAAKMVKFSVVMQETLFESYWYPTAIPIRIVVFLGIFLFTLQGMTQFIRDLYLVIRNKPL